MCCVGWACIHAPGAPWAALSLGLNVCDKQCYMGQLIGPIEGV